MSESSPLAAFDSVPLTELAKHDWVALPPDYDSAVPDGYMAARSQTYGVVFGHGVP